MSDNDGSSGLKCLVVGGSIAGLAAALALRTQGHYVKLYEQDLLGNRAGAGLAMFPNAMRSLRQLGVNTESTRPTRVRKMQLYRYGPDKEVIHDTRVLGNEWDWNTVLYPELFAALFEAILDVERPGPRVEIKASERVRSIDPNNGVIYLSNGKSEQGDVIIGADGVHSMCRTTLSGSDAKIFRLERGAFRATVTRRSVADDPVTRHFVKNPGSIHHFFCEDKAVFVAPCSNGEMLSIRATYIDRGSLSGSMAMDWRDRPSKLNMMKITMGLPEDWVKLLEKADSSSVQQVPIWDMDPLQIWNHSRLVVTGDAAHPMPPWFGQRTAVALEDAVSLGVFLERGSTSASVKERLAAFARIRKQRVSAVHESIREVNEGTLARIGTQFDTAFFRTYIVDYDEQETAIRNLKILKAQHPTLFQVYTPPVIEQPSLPSPPDSANSSSSKSNKWPKFGFRRDKSSMPDMKRRPSAIFSSFMGLKRAIAA